MSIGITNNCYDKVRVCTPELLSQALDSLHVAKTCAEIEDALEAYRRGELTVDEFDKKKSTEALSGLLQNTVALGKKWLSTPRTALMQWLKNPKVTAISAE